MEKTVKKNRLSKRKVGERIFWWSILLLPLIQFCIFYIVKNFNSILLAFQDIEMSLDGSGYKYSWVGFANFKATINALFNEPELVASFGNSLLAYAVGLIAGTGLALLFTYYIYKKQFFSGVFKIILFLPSIISSVAMILMFKYFIENAYPEVMSKLLGKRVDGLLANPDTVMGTLLFYSVWVGFGGSVLMYLGAMNGINESVVEAAYLDGITPLKEFIFIILPLIYPTLVTFLVTGLTGIFSNQIGLHAFFPNGVPESKYYTYGYYMFIHVADGMVEYPYMATMGLLMTMILAPITFLVRWALEKFGPSVE